MRYVEINDLVVYKKEKARVIGSYTDTEKRSYFNLKTSEGERHVPFLDIKWNGRNFFVTPDGHQRSHDIAIADSTIEKLVNCAESAKAKKLNVEEEVNKEFVSQLKEISAERPDKSFGFIVKEILKEIDSVESFLG